MDFNFRGFPAPYAFIIAYLIYFVKYETQNIFNFCVFWNRLLLFAVPAIPYDYIINLTIHNGSVMLPIVLASWFEDQNDAGEYVGNKLAKIRLQGSKVKPTGLPSELNSDVNKNLGSYIYDILDAKYVAYFIAIFIIMSREKKKKLSNI